MTFDCVVSFTDFPIIAKYLHLYWYYLARYTIYMYMCIVCSSFV